MDAIILAGGLTPKKLSAALGVDAPPERALLQVNGRAAIAYVLDSLADVSSIDRILVVGLPGTLQLVEQIAPRAIRVPASSTLVANVMAGMNAATSPQCLLCTCDIPFVTGETWREFLGEVERNSLDAAYPIVARQIVEQRFPDGKRTYATLTDGTFTGGNAFVLQRERSKELEQLVDAAYRARKNPLGLAKMLGVNFLLKALRKKLSVSDLEQKMSQVLGCRAGAVVMQDAGIAFDVDKIEDYEVAQKALAPSDAGAVAQPQ